MKRNNMKVDMDKERKTRKVRLDIVKEFAKSFGYEVLSKNYGNMRTKMELKCPERHTFRMAYLDFKQGKRCTVCAIENKKDLKKFTIEKIRDLFGKEGYHLISTEYSDSQDPLLAVCSEGHNINTSLYEFKKGIRCKECSRKAKGQVIDQDAIRNHISSQNYVLSTKRIVNLDSKILMRCDQGHKVHIPYNSFKSGERCSTCIQELDTPEILEVRKILKDILDVDFGRELVENNKAIKSGQVKYDGYNKELGIIFDITDKRDLNKLVFCRINSIMYLRIGKNEINKKDIYERLVDLGVIV